MRTVWYYPKHNEFYIYIRETYSSEYYEPDTNDMKCYNTSDYTIENLFFNIKHDYIYIGDLD